MENQLVLGIWVLSILLTVEDLGQFIIGCIASTGSIIRTYDQNFKKDYLTKENLLLIGCIGIGTALFYTWIRWDASQNTYIMYSKRYLIIPIQIISLSMLMQTKPEEDETGTKREGYTWIKVAALAAINITFTLPFAKSTLSAAELTLYFFTVVLASAVGIAASHTTQCKFKQAWALLFSITAIIVCWCSQSRIMGGIELLNLISLLTFYCNKKRKRAAYHLANRVMQLMQTASIYTFSILLPTLVMAGPWIISNTPNIISKTLWTLTGSRYFLGWSYSIWATDALGLRSAMNISHSIPYLETHEFYNHYLTEFYGTTSIELDKLYPQAHSSSIQLLIEIFGNSMQNIPTLVATSLITAYIIKYIFSLYRRAANTQQSKFILFSLCSNLLILGYITTESVISWQLLLILSGHALCIESIAELNNTNQSRAKINSNFNTKKILGAAHPCMIFAPYIILLLIPSVMLWAK